MKNQYYTHIRHIVFLMCIFFISCQKIYAPENELEPESEPEPELEVEVENSPVDYQIQPWKKNPWYWQYKGEPVLLLGISSDDNLFQWPEDRLIPHLDSMAEAGGNYVRNTMSDRRDLGFEVYPFQEIEGGKYNLDLWNEEYWERFEFFLEETEKRDIIVQIEVWDRFDYWAGNWLPHPYNPVNNVNYTVEESGLTVDYPQHPAGNHQPFFFTTPKQRNNETLLKYQEKFVERLLSVSLNFDHVLYCIDNETAAEEEWAIYWADLIKEKASDKDKTVYVTEMWGNPDLKSELHMRTFNHPERYAFCDVSQNNWQNGQVHWDNFQWVRDYISPSPRPVNTVKTYGSAQNMNGLERWWRHVTGGAASARFHRPPAGLGLSELSVTAVKAARKIESVVKFWELSPGNELLTMREENEAYLTSKPGESYVLYFTDSGHVGLDITDYNSLFSIKWLQLSTGEWESMHKFEGGRIVELQTPGPGSWVAVIRKIR